MKRIAFLGLLAPFLASCASTPVERVVVQTVEAKIPVPVGCKTNTVDRPAFAVDALPLGAEVDEQMRALRAERVQRKGYERELETEVARCAGVTNVD
jgi:hypothetical protein